MKITTKILSIPPYISTDWSQISAIHMKGAVLVISLREGDSLNIPGLQSETIGLIFSCHASYLENEQMSRPAAEASENALENLLKESVLENQEVNSFRLAFGPMGGLGIENTMQHNPAQANAPDLPLELLEKVTTIAKLIVPEEQSLLPEAEPSCNCFFCQISRALHAAPEASAPEIKKEEELEEITEEDLQFQQWDIAQTGDNLFAVTNRLDEKEKYNVFLGQPVGCTCGNTGCEHVLAVLKS